MGQADTPLPHQVPRSWEDTARNDRALLALVETEGGGGGGAPSGPAGGALDGTYPNPDLNSAIAGTGLSFASNVLSVNEDPGSVCAARLSRSTNITGTGSSWATVAMDTVVLNEGDMVQSNVITIPQAGVYAISGNAYFDGYSANSLRQIRIVKTNSAGTSQLNLVNTGGASVGYTLNVGSAAVELEVDDEIELQFRADAGTVMNAAGVIQIAIALVESKVGPTGPQGPQGPPGPSGGGGEAPTGATMSYAASTAPTGWLLADGSAVSRATYSDLFALFDADGLVFGSGDGSTTFNLPDLSGRIPVGVDTETLGDSGGATEVVLAETNLPSHRHPLGGNTGGESLHKHSMENHTHGAGGITVPYSNTSTQNGTNTNRWADGSGNTRSTNGHTAGPSALYTASGQSHYHSLPAATGYDGDGVAHQNMPPYLVLNAIIKT